MHFLFCEARMLPLHLSLVVHTTPTQLPRLPSTAHPLLQLLLLTVSLRSRCVQAVESFMV